MDGVGPRRRLGRRSRCGDGGSLQEILRLRAEVEALRADKERLDWIQEDLVEIGWYDMAAGSLGAVETLYPLINLEQALVQDLRAAIDTARNESQKETK